MNFMEENIGKKVRNKNTGQIGTFISMCNEPSFDIEFKNGNRVGGAINSGFAKDWEIYEEEDNWSAADIIDIPENFASGTKIISVINFKRFAHKIKEDILKVYPISKKDIVDIIDKRAGDLK